MQPIYLVQSSSGSGRWLQMNYQGKSPANVTVAVACNSTSVFQIDWTLDDVSGTFPNPTLGSSNPTIFSSFTGSSTAYATFGNIAPAAVRLTITTLSSVGAKCTATILQQGIG